jgi:hypothetical protein
MLRAPKQLVRRRCATGEAGFAVPTVLLALVAAFGLGTATIVASVGAEQGTTRDENSKAALAAAEAGVANAMLRYNTIYTDAGSTADDCVPVGGTSVPAGGWCPGPVTGTIDRGGYSFWVKPVAASGDTPATITIVSTGTVDGASRRVRTTADSIAEGFRPFAQASVIGLDSISMANGGAEIHANVATNGNIGIGSNSKLFCDYAQVGPGRGFSPVGSNSVQTCPPTQGTISLPPVNPGDVATNNQNGRICNLDPVSGTTCAGAWNPTTRIVDLDSGDSLTLGAAGGEFNYAFCRIDLGSNSYLHIANGATVRIYLLSPDAAPCLNESEPIRLHSNSKIEPTGADATSLQILIVGSDTRATSIQLDSNSFLFSCDQSFVVYAPRTALHLASNTAICGGIAAKSVSVSSNTRVFANGDADEWELPNEDVASHFGEATDFSECRTTITPTVPDEGC